MEMRGLLASSLPGCVEILDRFLRLNLTSFLLSFPLFLTPGRPGEFLGDGWLGAGVFVQRVGRVVAIVAGTQLTFASIHIHSTREKVKSRHVPPSSA